MLAHASMIRFAHHAEQSRVTQIVIEPQVIPIVKKYLVKKNLPTRLSAFDAWTFNTIRAMRGISEESMEAIDQLNVHTYIFFVNREDDAKRREVSFTLRFLPLQSCELL